MKRQNNQNKLAFGKATVAELTDKQMQTINGGSLDALGDIAGYIYDAGVELGHWLSKQV